MSGTNWDAEQDLVLEVLRPYLTTTEIFNVFQKLGIDRTKEAISRRARRLDVAFIDFGEPPIEKLDPQVQEAIKSVLESRVDILAGIKPPHTPTPSEKSKVSSALKAAAEDIREKLEEQRLETPRNGSIITKIASGSGESLCLLLSDFHIGRKVVDQSTQEVLYDVKIGIDRIGSIPAKVLSGLPKRLDKYDELVIMLCGDMVDGEDIFPGHAQQIQEVAETQATATVKAIWNMTKDLSKIFPAVRLVTVPGNHGRCGASNWDNVVYRQLELLIDDQNSPNISIRNRYEKFNILNVKGHKGLIRHHAPAQADTAASRAKLGGWYNIHKFNFMCYGHFHHWGIFTWQGKPVFRNGSLIGADDYAEELAVSDMPAQLMFGITEDTIPTAIVPLVF